MKTSIALAAMAAAGLSAGVAFASQPSVGSWDPAVGSRATKALNLLEAKGYGDFSNFQAKGQDFTATVTQHDRAVTLLVDPRAGSIRALN